MNRIIRQVHRWTSIAFTAVVIALFAASARGEVAQWLYLLPLAPLAVLTASGLWMFALPYLRRAP